MEKGQHDLWCKYVAEGDALQKKFIDAQNVYVIDQTPGAKTAYEIAKEAYDERLNFENWKVAKGYATKEDVQNSLI